MNKFKEYFLIALGVIMVGAGVYFFLIPHNIAAGGAAGLAIVLSKYLPLSEGTLMLAINFFLLVLGFLLIGPKFGLKTIVASLGTSGVVKVLEWLYPNPSSLSGDIMLEMFFGIIISAIGIGIVFNQGASTGGTDIIAKILNKFFGVDLGKGVLYSDLIITILAGFAFGAKIGLYSLFSVIINGVIIDFTIDGMNLNKEVTIVTNHPESITKFIHENLNKTCTLYHAQGGYSKRNFLVLVTILDRRSFVLLKNFIRDHDPDAFIWVKNSSEVIGLGFRSHSAD